MIAIALALASALAYGLSDFVGGLTSQRATPWSVGVVGQSVGGMALAVVAVAQGVPPGRDDVTWALLAGVGTGAGVAFLYRGLSSGRMGVVAPISGVGAALVPVAAGLLGGERPSIVVLAGLAIALPGIWLVARQPAEPLAGPSGGPSGLLDGALAGAGFGVLFAALGQVGHDAGLAPVAIAQAVGGVIIVAIALILGADWLPRRSTSWRGGAITGTLGATGVALFTIATHHGYLTVVGVIASLYPAATVILAATVLREQVHRAQAMGLAVCAVAVTLVALG